jgi:hypothetical protein
MSLLVQMVVVLFAICRALLTKQCLEGNFHIWPGINRDGVITQTIAEEVLVSSCQRICLLYTDCVGFNINITDSNLQTGFCSFLNNKRNWINEPEFNIGLAFYGK